MNTRTSASWIEAVVAAIALGLIALPALQGSAHAQGATSSAAQPISSLGNPSTGARIPKNRPPLPPLPKPPSLQLPAAAPDDVKALRELLTRLTGDDAALREDAARELVEIKPALVPAIREEIDKLADSADRAALKRQLEETRKDAREQERKRMRSAGESGEIVTPDYLVMLTSAAEPENKAWRELTRLTALSRMLSRVGTVEAARTLIQVYVRFGELLRVDTQLQLQKMGGKAIAALIETRRHKAESVARWAERQLDTLGKAIPGEAVNTTDYGTLADILRAYGRVRDPDALRIVISFANSERAQVREAARQAVTLMGEVGNWQLRDTYETIVGKKPPRDWTWERTARELFGEFDRLRNSQVYDLYEEGSLALERGDLEGMRKAFDKVLARSPEFEHAASMAPAYFAYAESVLETDPDQALLALQRAARLSDAPAQASRARSLALTLESERLLTRGVADPVLARRAFELDPSNQRARELLTQIERGESRKRGQWNRWAAAGAIGAVALLAIAFIGLRRRQGATPPVEGGG